MCKLDLTKVIKPHKTFAVLYLVLNSALFTYMFAITFILRCFFHDSTSWNTPETTPLYKPGPSPKNFIPLWLCSSDCGVFVDCWYYEKRHSIIVVLVAVQNFSQLKLLLMPTKTAITKLSQSFFLPGGCCKPQCVGVLTDVWTVRVASSATRMRTLIYPLNCVLCSLEHKTRPEVEFCDPSTQLGVWPLLSSSPTVSTLHATKTTHLNWP